MYKKIDHISLHVSDVENSIAFYNKMGFKSLPRPNFDFGGAWFAVGETQQIHLIAGLEENTISGNRSTHYAISVESITKFEAFLKQNEITYRAPKARPDGMMQIYVTDPDGYFWEFNEC